MESVCCGTPVVAYDCCGSPELVDNDSGYVVKEDDGDAIVEKINQIKTAPKIFSAEEKQKKFNKENCYDKYLTEYKEDI